MSVAAAAGKRLAGKVAIVTGGGAGFGAAIVRRFAQEGAKICVADMDVTNARPLAAEMSDKIMLHEMNVTKKADWDALVDKVTAKHGKIDCLINNAGTTHTNKVSGTEARRGRRRRLAGAYTDTHSLHCKSQRKSSTCASTSTSRASTWASTLLFPGCRRTTRAAPLSTWLLSDRTARGLV